MTVSPANFLIKDILDSNIAEWNIRPSLKVYSKRSIEYSYTKDKIFPSFVYLNVLYESSISFTIISCVLFFFSQGCSGEENLPTSPFLFKVSLLEGEESLCLHSNGSTLEMREIRLFFP